MFRVAILFPTVLVAAALCSCEGGKFPSLRPCSDLPAGFSVSYSEGPDFDLWRVRSDSESLAGSATLYFGDYPEILAPQNAEIETGTLLAKPATWKTWITSLGEVSESVISYTHDAESRELKVHAFVGFSTAADAVVIRSWISELKVCEQAAV